MAITLTHEEAQEAISVAKQAIEDVERLRGELDHVRAEFALENGKDSPADNEHRMCDEEAEKLDRRLTAMRDEHMLATLMMSSKWLQGCLTGKNHYLMTAVIAAIAEVFVRWMPADAFDEAMAIYDDEREFDLAYLDDLNERDGCHNRPGRSDAGGPPQAWRALPRDPSPRVSSAARDFAGPHGQRDGGTHVSRHRDGQDSSQACYRAHGLHRHAWPNGRGIKEAVRVARRRGILVGGEKLDLDDLDARPPARR